MQNDKDLIQVLAINTDGKGEWLDYSTTGAFLCPVSEANSLLHGEIAFSSAKKVFRMLKEFVTHEEDFGNKETWFVCSYAPEIRDIPDVFHRIIYTVLNQESYGKIRINRSRGDEDCDNSVVILMMLVKNLLTEDKDEEMRITRDISSIVANQVTDYFEASNLRRLSASLDVEELNLSKLFQNQIAMHGYWTKFSRWAGNTTDNIMSEIGEINKRQEDMEQQGNLLSFVQQMRSISGLYFSHLISGSFYNTNTYVFLSQALLGGAASLHGTKQCQYYSHQLLCHLSLPTYNYLPEEKILAVGLYAENVDFGIGQIYKCVPKYPNGMTSIRNHRVIINKDKFYQVIQTDDSKLYRNDTIEEYKKQHLISSPWKCFFNGASSQFIMSCESESTVTTKNRNKVILPQFQAMRISKEDFPLVINGLELQLDKVMTQIVHSNALNVAAETYTSISATPSQFHQVIQDFRFDEEEPEFDFQMIWKHNEAKTYITVTSIIIGILAVVGLVWCCSKCCRRCMPRLKGYRIQLPIRGNRESDEVEFSERKSRAPSAPALEEGEGSKNVTFSTRDQSTSVYPRGKRSRI